MEEVRKGTFITFLAGKMRNLVSLFSRLTFAGYRDVLIKASYLNELLKESVYVSV